MISAEDKILFSKPQGEQNKNSPYQKKMTKVCKRDEAEISALFEVLFKNKQYTDITFVVEGQKFPAHKGLLASNCKFFEDILASYICNFFNIRSYRC